MEKFKWDVSTDPEPMLRLILPTARDEHIRMFACACCRRIWHLLEDRRLRDALHIAEKFARGKTTSAKLEVASHLADDASEAASLAEWIAEADWIDGAETEAEVSLRERWFVVDARQYAAHAVVAAVSVNVIVWEHDFYRAGASGVMKDVPKGSHTWAAAARGAMAAACVLDYFRGPEKDAIRELISLAMDSARDAEKRAQADLLRSLFEYPAPIARSGKPT